MNEEKKSQDEEVEIIGEGEEIKDAKIKKLQEELELCRKEKDDYLKGWQRAKADFINYKKEEEKERLNFLKFAEKNFIAELLPIIDSFEAAGKDMNKGLWNIYAKFKDLLKSHNISEIEAIGKKFNPLEHEALEQKDVSNETEDGLILTELQKGYKMHDVVIRPARVAVGVYKTKN